MRRYLWFVFVSIFCIPALAEAFELPKKTASFRDWRDGDLIFHDSGRNIQTRAIALATGSPYTHTGIIKLTRKGPVVIEAVGPVIETPLEKFIARGRGKIYSVYRVKNLSGEKAQKVIAEAKKFYGRPYDIFFRMDDQRIYCSELPYKAFAAAGVPIGQPQKFRELNINNQYVRALFQARWQEHPECRKGISSEQCWNIMLNQEIISPGRLTEDARLKHIYSSSSSTPKHSQKLWSLKL